jgi:hypothetical protein
MTIGRKAGSVSGIGDIDGSSTGRVKKPGDGGLDEFGIEGIFRDRLRNPNFLYCKDYS